MAVSVNSGSFKRVSGSKKGGLGLISGRFRVNTIKELCGSFHKSGLRSGCQ